MHIRNLMNGLLPPIIEIFSFVMLVQAFRISIAKTVHQMIPLYRSQSYYLALVTFFTAIEPNANGEFTHLNVGIFVIIPLLLAIGIRPLLAQATVPEDVSIQERLKRLFVKAVRIETRERAVPIWLEYRFPVRNQVFRLGIDLSLIVAAYMTAFSVIDGGGGQANSLAISVALLLLGLSTMNHKDDLISQIMGLLVMEHGLFLAAVKVIASPSVAIQFVISLFLYIIITLTILLFLLPELHRISGSIEVKDQQQLKG